MNVASRTPTSNRLLPLVAGPELYWLLVCIAMYVLGAGNTPPTEAGSRSLEQFWSWLPFVFVPAAFLCYRVPGASRWGLLVRIDLATVVGLTVATTIITGAVDYGDSRKSGTGSGFIMSLAFGLAVLFLANVVAAIVLWRRGRAREGTPRG